MPYVGRDLNRGNYLKLDDISSSFDGSETTFNLTTGGQAFYPGSAFSILVVLAGVIQEPESAYTINQSEITFASAPVGGDDFFCIVLGVALGVGVPGNGTVNGTQLASPFSYDGFFYLNDVTNRVGINSSVPTTALDVQGTVTATEFVGNISNPSGISTFYNLTVENDLTVNGSFTTLDTIVTEVDKLEVGANNTTVGVAITQSGTGDILRLYDSSTQVVTVTDGGNVGIGSETPQATLDVASTTPVIRFTDTDAGQYTEILHSGSSFYITADRGNSGNGDIIFRSGGTSEKVRITSDGKVGIGTNSPGALLEVYGPTTSTMYIRGGGPGSDTARQATLGLYASGSKIYNLRADASDGSFQILDSSTERLRIDGYGKVGIGTNNPSMPLHLNTTEQNAVKWESSNSDGPLIHYYNGTTHLGNVGNSKGVMSSTDLHFGIGSKSDLLFGTKPSGGGSTVERLRITSTGNVGIGLTNPVTNLTVYGNASAVLFQNSNTGTTGGDGFFVGNYGGLTASIWQYENDVITFGTNNTERLRITSGGSVGIGTDNPQYKLEVQGATTPAITVRNTTTSSYSRLSAGEIGDGEIFAFQRLGSTSSASGGPKAGQIWNYADAPIVMGIGSTERLRITSGGNMGLGVTPESWGTNFRAFQIGSTGSLASQVGARTIELATNAYNNSGWKYTDSDVASLYYQYNGEHIFSNAPSGTDDASCTFTERLRITSDGEVTKPAQPRFWAYLTNSSIYDGRNVGGTWVEYNATVYNIGNNFATSGADTGRFIAPVDGMYLFHAAAYKSSGTAWSQSWFDVDGSRASATDWVMGSSNFAQNAVQIYLTAGQKVGFHPYNNLNSNTVDNNGNHTWFKGCLLF